MPAESLQMCLIKGSCMNIPIKTVAPDPGNQFFICIHHCNPIHMKFRQKMICSIAETLQFPLNIECCHELSFTSAFSKSRSVFQSNCDHPACAELKTAKTSALCMPLFFIIFCQASALYLITGNRRSFFPEKNEDPILYADRYCPNTPVWKIQKRKG